MQQFTVPQFIDVENKIIGPITSRQFLILLAAAVIIGLSYKFFDFSLFLTISIIVFIIAVLFSFVKVNGRPFHYFILNITQTIRRPGTRVWNNRTGVLEEIDAIPFVKPEAKPVAKEVFKTSRLAELALIVDTKGRYKGE